MRLPGFENVLPPVPTVQTDFVAKRIAERIVAEINLDDFYWEPHQIADRVWEMQQVIMSGEKPRRLVRKLARQFNYHGWQWDGIDSHCNEIAQDIFQEELDRAVSEYRKKYEISE